LLISTIVGLITSTKKSTYPILPKTVGPTNSYHNTAESKINSNAT